MFLYKKKFAGGLARASVVVFLLDFFLALGIYLSVSKQKRQMAAPVRLGRVSIPKDCIKEKADGQMTVSEVMEIEG